MTEKEFGELAVGDCLMVTKEKGDDVWSVGETAEVFRANRSVVAIKFEDYNSKRHDCGMRGIENGHGWNLWRSENHYRYFEVCNNLN